MKRTRRTGLRLLGFRVRPVVGAPALGCKTVGQKCKELLFHAPTIIGAETDSARLLDFRRVLTPNQVPSPEWNPREPENPKPTCPKRAASKAVAPSRHLIEGRSDSQLLSQHRERVLDRISAVP